MPVYSVHGYSSATFLEYRHKPGIIPTYNKSRANILTRVQNKAYTEPSSLSFLFNLPYSKGIHYFSHARHIAHHTGYNSVSRRKFCIYYSKL